MTFVGTLIDKYVHAPARRMRASQFEEFDPAPHSIVLLGDSITAGGLWHEWFPGMAVANRGIDGDTTAGVLDRLPTATQGPPVKVFVLIGTNDLTQRVRPERIAANVVRIVTGLRTLAPDVTIVLQSVFPRQVKYRERIDDLNGRYREIASVHGSTYLDLWPALADESGGLRDGLTLDKLHLNGAGYRAWVHELRPVVLNGLIDDHRSTRQAAPESPA